MVIRLKELRVIPALMALVFAMYNSLSFTALEMQMASYLMLALMLLTTCVSTFLVVHNRGISRYPLVILFFLIWVAAVTMIYGNDLKNWIYGCMSIVALLFLFDYYRDDIRPLVIGALIGFTIAIYAALWQLVTNPSLWFNLNENENVVSGFLLGGNYNQMGPRLLCGIATNILCLKYSKWFWIPLIPLVIICIALLLMVQSMTSLVGLLLLVVFCCLPGIRFPRFCITGLICTVVLFQVLVCFNGKGIENNETAVWFIVDVLGKDITFTYRTDLWDAAMRLFTESPLTGYGFPSTEWYLSNLSSFAIGPHNQILGLMLYGGLPGITIFVTLLLYACFQIQKIKDRYATALYATTAVLLLTSLMEIYSMPIVFFIIVLTYYYGQSASSSLESDEHKNENHSQHPCTEHT